MKKASRSQRATHSLSSTDAQDTAAGGGGRLLLDEPVAGVARLTISNPGKRGALDHAILDGLATTMPRLDAHCVIITGEQNTFSAGYDIGTISDSRTFADEAEQLIAHPFTEAIEAVEAYPYPTLAVLNGHVIGGGLELAVSCDLRIAAATIALGMPPAKLGLVYSHTGIAKFIDTIGAARTRELFLVGRRIDARTARSWGLVNAVAEPGRLAEEALESGGRDRRQRAAGAAWQQARDPCGAGVPGRARSRGRTRVDRGAAGLLLLRGFPRGRERVRREAHAGVEGAVGGRRAAVGGRPTRIYCDRSVRDQRLGGVPAERTLLPGIRRKLCVGWTPQHGQCSCRDNPAPRAAVCPPRQEKVARLRPLRAPCGLLPLRACRSRTVRRDAHSVRTFPRRVTGCPGPALVPKRRTHPTGDHRAPARHDGPLATPSPPSNADHAITHPLDAPFSRLDRPWPRSPCPARDHPTSEDIQHSAPATDPTPSGPPHTFRAMPPLITPEEALRLGELEDHAEIEALVERAWQARRRALRRLDRHVLAGQREVGRLRRGLRLLRAVTLRGGRHADARDDGARADPRARPRRRGRPGAHRFCMVTQGQGLSKRDFEKVLAGARLVAEHTNLKRCVSIGHMSAERAKALKDAGIQRVHHNVETAESYYPEVSTTVRYEGRLRTIDAVREAGLETCVGGILNLGETRRAARRDGLPARRRSTPRACRSTS